MVVTEATDTDVFLFQIGSIRRELSRGFYDHLKVSIPDWFD